MAYLGAILYYALLGEKEQALAWLRQAVELGNHNYPWFERDRNYDKLRGDPDYEHILTEVRQHWEHYIARRRKAEWEFCLKGQKMT